MSENTVRKEERVSRLNLVRSGGTALGAMKLPRRGRTMVEIDAIVPDPKNERKAFRGLDELAASIKQVGIVEAPTVVPLEDGRYLLTTGERRWRAAKKAGLKQIAVIIGDPEEDRQRRIKSLVSNVQREDLSALELAAALQEMKEENPDAGTNRRLAVMVGKSEQWVGQMLKVRGLPEQIQEELRRAERAIPYDSVIEIARVEDPESQAALVKRVLAGATVREVREKAKATKSSPAREGKSSEKIKVSMGWVVVHCSNKDATKGNILAALQEAIRTVKERE